VADKVMPGFGEQMRQISLAFVPTAILSRQVAVIRGKALIINLPGQPKSIAETLQGLPQATRRCTASSRPCPIAWTSSAGPTSRPTSGVQGLQAEVGASAGPPA
jgi:molybdopterin adenylyltransferase